MTSQVLSTAIGKVDALLQTQNRSLSPRVGDLLNELSDLEQKVIQLGTRISNFSRISQLFQQAHKFLDMDA